MIKEKVKKFFEFSYTNRFYIAIFLFIICILFELSGSSIGVWNDYNLSDVDDGVLMGVSRSVRSDEWAVLTPMTFSQFFDGFKYFSSLIRGGNTDVFMVYGLPVLTLVQIYRPFQLGFLFLGIAKGLSFFWYGRLIALFLVMFELMMLITNNKKKLSFVGALMITLAPIIQWWFAVNGIVELFVFGGLAIILLDKYMLSKSLKKRIIYLLFLILCAGGYLMVLYPAWQISLAYIFGVLAIWVIIKDYKSCKINYKDIICIILALLIFIVSILYIFTQSKDTLISVLNTVYPGSRNETGGEQISYSLDYILGPFLSYTEEGLNKNLSSKSMFYTLFPIGIILTLRNIFKEKNKDILSIMLLVIYVFLGIFYIFGLPSIVTKLTLLSKVTAKRAVLAIGFMDIILLFRSLALQKKEIDKKVAIIISLVLSIILVIGCKYFNQEYFKSYMIIISLILISVLMYFSMRYNSSQREKNIFCVSMSIVMIVCGFFVNPIRVGVDNIYNSSLTKEVQKINEEDPGKWIASGFPISNFILMAGVPVINSTNVYPNMELWEKIDSEGIYENVYNRYAHINVVIISDDENVEQKFYLNQSDVFTVYLTTSEIKSLDVKYVFTEENLEIYDTSEINFNSLYEFNGRYIYKVEY